MSKYDSAATEAASVIANHGFAQEQAGTVEYGPGWHAWCVVSPVVMMNLGETELAGALLNFGERDVIICEDSNGFVTGETYVSTKAAEAAWAQIVAETDAAEDDDEN